MSYPYPQDRTRDQQTKGEQPYQDAKEAMAQSEVQIQGDAEAFGEALRDESGEDRATRIAAEMEDRVRATTREVAAAHDDPQAPDGGRSA